MFGLLKAEERKRRRNVQLDRRYLEARSRRFLKIYLKNRFKAKLLRGGSRVSSGHALSKSSDLLK